MKKKKWVIISLIIILFILVIFLIKLYYFKNNIKDIYLNYENKIIIELVYDDDTYCKFENQDNWIISKNNKCILDFSEKNDYIYLKNKYGYITKIKNKHTLSAIKDFYIKNNIIYLAINGEEKINYYLDSITKKDDKIKFSSLNDSIAAVDNNGMITGKNVGDTKIMINLENYTKEVTVIVTDKIIAPKNDYDYKRNYVSCNEFSEDDNNLIDQILFNRIDKVGIGTRAAVVEAARFMTLEFSKRIPYFAENGRLTINGVDAEGRFYKKGMFLSSSKYADIKKSMHGPASWGCKIYSYPVERIIPNGLDCSGFVAWAFINAGFDVGDIGAGITPVQDFTDLGIKKNIKSSINNKEIIVGDLLSGKFSNGGHIAIVSGITDEYYYISESLYEDNHTYYGVITRKYNYDELSNFFSWHIDMSDFYQEDGLLTDYWIN